MCKLEKRFEFSPILDLVIVDVTNVTAIRDLHDYAGYVMARSATPTYGIKKGKKSHREHIINHDLSYYWIIPYISKTKSTTFATIWYYSHVESIDG